MKILILSSDRDVGGKAVAERLQSLGAETIFVDWFDHYEMGTSICINEATLRLRIAGADIDTSDIGAVLLRRWPTFRPDREEDVTSSALLEFYQRNALIKNSIKIIERACKTAYWMSTPTAIELSELKLFQQVLAQQVGLKTPTTLGTNSPSETLRFREDIGGEVCCKFVYSFLPIPAHGADGRLRSAFTNILQEHHLENLSLLKTTAALFQRYIPKAYELRITYVGGKMFACRIDSQRSERTRIDWRRYDIPNTPHSEEQLPPETNAQLENLMRGMGLNFGAIDMIVTPEGEYVFLEVNGTGEYMWIERLTGMPITNSIADTLLIHAQGPMRTTLDNSV